MTFLISFLMLIFLLPMAFTCKAATVWSDNFDDRNYQGWVVYDGMFSADDGTLKTVLGDNYYEIVHLSSVASGTWSFDVLVGTETDIYFMYTPALTAEDQDQGMVIYWFGTHIRLYSISSFYAGGSDRLGEYIFSGSISGWYHIDITHNSNGRTCIYHNGSLILDVVDRASITSSEYFIYEPIGEAAIDNIAVSNTIDIEPPPPIPFYMQIWFIEAVGIIAVAGVVITVFLRRRKYQI